jgi:hypothetical protein
MKGTHLMKMKAKKPATMKKMSQSMRKGYGKMPAGMMKKMPMKKGKKY